MTKSQIQKPMTALALVAALVAAWSLASGPVSGQGTFARDTPRQPGAKSWLARRAKLPPFTPPRTPDGKPDLQAGRKLPLVG